MTNIHENCDNYVKSKDMCLRFFEWALVMSVNTMNARKKQYSAIRIFKENGVINLHT